MLAGARRRRRRRPFMSHADMDASDTTMLHKSIAFQEKHQ
jgi:hypothetical protein